MTGDLVFNNHLNHPFSDFFPLLPGGSKGLAQFRFTKGSWFPRDRVQH